MIARKPAEKTLEATIAANLKAIYEYSAAHPGVLAAAMTDELVIDAEGAQATPLLVRWGLDWGRIVREAIGNGLACATYNPEIVGQAILGAIHQTASEGARSQRGREEVLDNLTRFPGQGAEALEPIRKELNQFEGFAASRLSMMRIMARRMKAATVVA
ncbi:MAG: hypothetical protein WDM81_04495 [Rhizomicrobium sp.]